MLRRNSSLVLFALFFTSLTASAAEPKEAAAPATLEPTELKKEAIAWSVTSGLDKPESAYYDAGSKAIYVSNISGEGDKKDGKGYISKVGLDGKMIAVEWAKGLDAPKGMRAAGGLLWVTDITRVLSFDLKTGKPQDTLEIAAAKFLNDIATDNEGNLYVSDMRANKIYRIAKGKATVWAEGEELETPNGLLVHDDKLIVAGWGNTPDPKPADFKPAGRLFALDLSRTETTVKASEKELLTQQPLGNLDGVENDGSGGYYVSDWSAGKVYRVSPDGVAQVILGGYSKGTADIGLMPDRLLILPRMIENILTAFDLDKLGQ